MAYISFLLLVTCCVFANSSPVQKSGCNKMCTMAYPLCPPGSYVTSANCTCPHCVKCPPCSPNMENPCKCGCQATGCPSNIY